MKFHPLFLFFPSSRFVFLPLRFVILFHNKQHVRLPFVERKFFRLATVFPGLEENPFSSTFHRKFFHSQNILRKFVFTGLL